MAGTSIVTPHLEADTDLERTLNRSNGKDSASEGN